MLRSSFAGAARRLRGGLKLTERIVTQRFTFDEEIAAGKPAHRSVVIGSIEDIVKIHAL